MNEQEYGSANMSKVRKLPPGWKWVKLGELMSATTGIVDPAKYPDEIFKLYSIPAHDIGQPALVAGALIGSSKLSVEKGDVLLSKIVPHIRRTWVVAEGGKNRQIASTEWIVFRTKLADPDFLRFMLRDNAFHKQLMDTTSGVGGSLTRARPSLVAKIEIPFPPLSEQKHIAAILNEQLAAVDKARAAAEAQLEAAKALPGAYLREVFPRPGQELAAGWKWVKLGDVCEIVTGGTPPRAETEHFTGQIPWIKPEHLDKDVSIDKSTEYLTSEAAAHTGLLPKGTVLVSCIGKIGKLAVAGVPLTTNQQINSLIPGGQIDTMYLYYCCKSYKAIFKLASSMALVPILNKTSFSSISVPLPPIPEQRRIAAILNEQLTAVDRACHDSETQLKEINALPSSLLRKAFNGEL